MKTFKKSLKFGDIFLILLITVVIGYSYSLTFNPYGRMDWRQAVFCKMVSFNSVTEEQLKQMTLEDYRNILPQMSLEPVNSIDTLKITQDSLPLYIYKPQGLTANAPVVIYYHGGGWFMPFNSLSNSITRQYCNRFKAIVVSVDYRTAPGYPFPTHIKDSYNTFKWVIENAHSIGGDSDKIAVIGESAGGNIAAVVCQKAKSENLTNIKYQVLFCPSTDVGNPQKYPSTKKFATGYLPGKSEVNFVINNVTSNVRRPHNHDSL